MPPVESVASLKGYPVQNAHPSKPFAPSLEHEASPNLEEELDLPFSESHESSQSSGTEFDLQQSSHKIASEFRPRKRKRKDDNAGLEASYMQQLANEEARRAAKKRKGGNTAPNETNQDNGMDSVNEPKDLAVPMADADDSENLEDKSFEIPQHEALSPNESLEFEKSNRTIFLGNVSTEAITSKKAKKTLLNHLSSILDSLPSQNPPHKVESLRFRSTAYDVKLPKKAAFARKELMDTTTKSTNAYVVYNTQTAAREAVKRLNGSVVLDRHLRVDSVAHPQKSDHRRCVFVGNLDFVDDDNQIREANEEQKRGRKKDRKPADVEEGLWRQFATVGTVESVRVVRDPKTRVGKGFAYVQFTDENAVEAALLFNDKKFPPLLPRRLRVVRAKSAKRNNSKRPPTSSGLMNPKEQSMRGRAGKLLGRAAAVKLKRRDRNSPLPTSIQPLEAFAFEGYRASSKQGTANLKLGGSGKRKDKSKFRSSKRSAAWKASGGKRKAMKEPSQKRKI